jgi:NTP pyrophosphatase (non-canonical NTP hydrolase)
MPPLSFADFRRATVASCTEGWHLPLDAWSYPDWLVAVGGELGQALNLVKKLNRERDAIIGNGKSAPELLRDLADELADTVIYLDLLLASEGQDFGFDHFGEIAPVVPPFGIGLSVRGSSAMVFAGRLAAAETVSATRIAARGLLLVLGDLANAAGIELGAAVVAKFNATSARHGLPHRLETT